MSEPIFATMFNVKYEIERVQNALEAELKAIRDLQEYLGEQLNDIEGKVLLIQNRMPKLTWLEEEVDKLKKQQNK